MTQPTVSKHWRKRIRLQSHQVHVAVLQKYIYVHIRQLTKTQNKYTHINEMILRTVKWAQCDKIQSTELIRTAHLNVLMLYTTSVHSTTQNSSDNPSYLQTILIAQMLSIGGEGAYNPII